MLAAASDAAAADKDAALDLQCEAAIEDKCQALEALERQVREEEAAAKTQALATLKAWTI